MDFPGPFSQTVAAPPEPALTSLTTAETFALWAIRLWVCAYRNNGTLLPELRQGFVVAGAPRGWLALDEFMTRLLGSVKRPLDLRSPRAAHLSIDEQGLLRWLSGLQRDAAPPPCANLRAIAAPGAVLAQALADAGLIFDGPELGSEDRAGKPERRLH
jgi:hypothetical protein